MPIKTVTLLTAEQLTELEDKNPDGVVHIIGKDNRWECVFRTPRGKEFKRYKSMCHNPAQVSEANDVLARQLVVYPDSATFDALLDRFPAIPATMAANAEFQSAIGATEEERLK